MAAWTLGNGGIMTFTPTWEQFQDFQGFISYMEEQGAHHCGVAKVGAWSLCTYINIVLPLHMWAWLLYRAHTYTHTK